MVFDPESGDTHLLSLAAVDWLERLRAAPEGMEVEDSAASLLETLRLHRLVEPVP